jgi:hypothetical protein
MVELLISYRPLINQSVRRLRGSGLRGQHGQHVPVGGFIDVPFSSSFALLDGSTAAQLLCSAASSSAAPSCLHSSARAERAREREFVRGRRAVKHTTMIAGPAAAKLLTASCYSTAKYYCTR